MYLSAYTRFVESLGLTFEQTVMAEDSVTLVCGIVVGFIAALFYVTFLFKKLKLDYTLPAGTFLRMKHGKKDWIVFNPVGTMHGFEALFLYYFRKRKVGDMHTEITEHEVKRARIIIFIIFAVALILICIGLYFSLLNVHYKKDFIPLEPNS